MQRESARRPPALPSIRSSARTSIWGFPQLLHFLAGAASERDRIVDAVAQIGRAHVLQSRVDLVCRLLLEKKKVIWIEMSKRKQERHLTHEANKELTLLK